MDSEYIARCTMQFHTAANSVKENNAGKEIDDHNCSLDRVVNHRGGEYKAPTLDCSWVVWGNTSRTPD
jgi:hypothetical protein